MSQHTETTDAGDPVSKNADSSISQEAQNNMNQNDQRKMKSLAILQHRKMLLERLQLCKRATQTRLNEYEKPSCEKKGLDAETNNEMIASRKRKFKSKEEEIKTYNELSEYAMNFTVKKAPIKPPPAPTPRNISLRTGSSVGNKMKAAVATLTTNVGWISDASSSSSQVQRNTSISPIAPGSINPVQASIVPSSQNEGVASLKTDKPIEQKQQMNGKSATYSISDGAQFPLSNSLDVLPINPNINVKKVDVSVGKQAKKRLSQSGKKINKKSSKSRSSSNEPLPVTSKPIHQMVQKSIPTLMIDESRSSRPPIICPEADRLRKKRRLLVQKLDSLIKNTYADAMIIKQSSEGRILKRLHYDDNPYSSANKIAWQRFMKADEPPCMLPERRKTQWDYVLEEMRWLSTDFIEEKKWKMSTAKVVATNVLKHRAEKFNQIKSSPKKLIKSSSIEKKEISQIKEVTIETKGSKEDESMDEESDTESVTEERVSTLEFVDPTDDDLENVKDVSSKIDKMIIDTWIIRRNEDSYQDNTVPSTSKTEKNTTDYNDENECTMKQLTFIEMKDEVEKICDHSNHLHAQDDMDEDIIQCIKDAQVQVYDDQLQILHHTMSLWQASKGSILSGPIGCGKTFMTSLLAWTRRNEGVQIVICPSISVFRWRRELNGFSDLNVVVVKSEETLHSCLDSQNLSQLVIVCDFTTFGEFCKSGRNTSFASIFVDLRCTSFPSSSLTSDTISNRGQKQRIVDHGKTTIDKIHGKEISSIEWWDRLITSAVSVETRCMLVETNSVFEGLDFPHKSHNVDKDQQIPGVLSSKIAFLFKETFYSKNKTFSRRAFWWARKYFISNSDDANMLKRAEKIDGAQSILRQFLKDIIYKPDIVKEEIGESLASCVPKWTIQICPMAETQRFNYEQECLFARGAFQNDALNQGTSFTVSKALLRLRRLCFGSDFADVLNGSNGRAKIKNNDREIASSSQPNVEKAKSLLESSSKLRQLLTILCKDCGFDVPVKNYLLGSKTTRRGRKSSASKRKKVLILASLPEVLLLLSSFLNALGIAHKLLAPPVLSKQQSQEEDSCQRLWMENQIFLDLYNYDSDDQSQKSTAFSLNVLVSSPEMLASTSFGIGASNADVVVSVDEDWSGSSDLSVFSILRKNVMRNSQKVTGRKFIKIISEDSCEQTFLTHEKSRGKKASLALPFLSSTLLNTSFKFEKGETHCDLPEVGWKIFRHVGLSLDSIFCVETLDQNIYGQRLIFLASPVETNEDFQLSSLPQSWEKAAVLDEVTDKEETDKNFEKYKFLREAILNVEQNVSISFIAASSVESTALKEPYLYHSCDNSIESTFQKDTLRTIHRYIGSRRNTFDKDESKTNEYLNHGIIPELIPGTNGVKKEKVKVQKEMEVSSAKSFSGCISEKMPSSLLWYKNSSMSSSRRVDTEASDSVAPQRVNGHVRSYMSSKKTFDGNQGCESLVYFPPIIPGVVGSSKSLETDISSIDRGLENVSESKKRKHSAPTSQGSSKKIRGSNPTTVEPLDFSPNLNNNGVGQPLPNIPGDFLNDVDFMDDSNDLFGGEDFFSDLGNIAKEDEILSPPKPCEEEQEVIETIDVVDVIKPSLDEDFGILGPGIMPPLEESSMVAMKEVIRGNSHSYWLDPSEPKLCDDFLSSGGLSLDSTIIHVTKTNAKTGNEGSGSQIGPLVHGSSINSASIFHKTPSAAAFIAPTMSSSVNKSILPYSAHHGIYPILIHHRLQDAFDPSANHIGNGMLSSKNQNSLVSQFSIRELDKDEHTGDTAKYLAEEQLSNFFSKSSSSNGADFGPFSANVLPSFSVWDDSISQETKSGIQLPMGVKLPKSVGMLNIKGEEWSTEEDTTLKHFVVELKRNWHAISQAITHNSANSVCQDSSMSPNPIRSARACKERWDIIKTTDTMEKKSFVESRKSDKIKHDFPVLLDANKANQRALSSGTSVNNSTRYALLRFKRLKKSREKINLVPLTIPGHAGAIVSSHSSHSQSVQDAISQSARPSGIVPPRAEMWPLQFLDLTEKQKRQVEAQKKGSQIVGGTGMIPSQPTAVPPHNMPGRHPTNQQMPVATSIPSRRPPQQHPVPHAQNQHGNYTAPVGAVPPPRQTQPQQSTSPQGTSNNR